MTNLVVLVLGCLMLTYSCNGSVEEIVREMQRELQQLKTKTASYEKETQDLKTKTASYENEIQQLKMKTASYEKGPQDLKMKTTAYENEIQDLKMKTALYEKETQQLKSENRFLWDEMKVLKTSVSSCESSIKSSANELLAFHQQLNDLKDKRGDGTNEPKRRFVLGANVFAEKPAFSAGITNHVYGLGNNQPIVFHNVFTNDLGGYSGVTGVFTAPMNGTYFFTAAVMSHNGQYLETQICLNGNSLVYMYSYDTHFEQGTNSVVLVLKSGDKVWVRHHGTEGSNAYGDNWSTFSGFMI